MTELTGDRRYAIHYRTKNTTHWRFATYAGRWCSEERAIQEVRDRLQGANGQYRIDDYATGTSKEGAL